MCSIKINIDSSKILFVRVAYPSHESLLLFVLFLVFRLKLGPNLMNLDDYKILLRYILINFNN